MKKCIFLTLICLFSSGCAQAEPNGSGKFVFTSDRQKGHQHETFLLKNNRMTSLGDDLNAPVFSPDGKKIAGIGPTHKTILIADESGRELQSVLVDSQLNSQVGHPVWTPDQKHILFTEEIEPDVQALVKYNFSTGEKEQIASFGKDTFITFYSVSPDGKRVQFDGDTYGNRHPEANGLFVADIDGGNLRKVYPYAIGGIWFPDNKSIGFFANTSPDLKPLTTSISALFKMDLESGKMEKIMDLDFLPAGGIKLSKDGKYFYTSKSPGKGGAVITLMPVDNPKKEIYVTKSVPNWLGYSNDTYPDWYQGE